jgi:hypothetical protein
MKMKMKMKMKIKPEHYEHLRAAAAAYVEQAGRARIAAYKQQLSSDQRVKDVDMRLGWDMLRATVPYAWVCDNLYPYINDTHIDIALRAIVAELKL